MTLAKCLFFGCLALIRHINHTPAVIQSFALLRDSTIEYVNVFPDHRQDHLDGRTRWWLNNWNVSNRNNASIIRSHSFFTPTYNIFMESSIQDYSENNI